MTATREDMLAELALLPLWQRRASADTAVERREPQPPGQQGIPRVAAEQGAEQEER